MTVWVFGDSFAEDYNFSGQWMSLISNKLNTDVKCYGLQGTSIEYTYFKFNKIRNQIKKNDIIVLCLTSLHRRWFFDDPTISSQTDVIYSSEDKPIKLYRLYLDNDALPSNYLHNFLYNVNHLSKTLDLKTLVIPAFYELEEYLIDKKNLFLNISFAKGNLNTSCLEEAEKKFHEIFFDSKDPRVNHFCATNHIILADKIVDWINRNTIVDLQVDFKKNIFVRENLTKEFIDIELFGKQPHINFFS